MPYLFLVIYTLAYTEIGEFCKTGAFVKHYYEHKILDKELTLTEYFEMHYTDCGIKENTKDQQLPFKGNDCTEHMLRMGYINPEIIFSMESVNTGNYIRIAWPQKEYLFRAADDIWQPPKQA